MTKIHNAFSSEEWKERFENDFNYMRPSEGQKARGESGVLNPYDFEDIGKWFAAELEKKEKEVNEIIKSIVPEKKDIKNHFAETIGELMDFGYNAAIDELNKNIGE